MARMIDILRKLRRNTDAQPSGEPNPIRGEWVGDGATIPGVMEAIDQALASRPVTESHPAAQEGTIESELRELLATDGPLVEMPKTADAACASDGPPEEQPEVAEPEPEEEELLMEPPDPALKEQMWNQASTQPATLEVEATEPLEPASPSEILTHEEIDALLPPVDTRQAAGSADSVETAAAQAAERAPEPIEMDSVEDIVDKATEMAAQIETEIESLADSVPVDVPPSPEESVAEHPAPPTDAREQRVRAETPEELQNILTKYGIKPGEMNLPSREEWEASKEHKAMSAADLEAQRAVLLQEMGLDLETLQQEESDMSVASPAEPETEPEAEPEAAQDSEPEANLADFNALKADLEDEFESEIAASKTATEPHEETDAELLDDLDPPQEQQATPPEVSEDTIAAEPTQETNTDQPSNDDQPLEPQTASPEALPAEAPEVAQEAPPPPAAVTTVAVDPDTIRAELDRLDAEPASSEEEETYVNSTAELVKMLVGLLSIAVFLVILMKWFLFP